MKIIKYIAIILSALWLVSACSDDDKIIFDPDNVQLGKLDELSSQSFILLEKNKDITFQTFKWEKFDFGYQAAITYVLQTDLAGKNFESAQTLGFTKSQSLAITVKAINSAILTLIEKYDLSVADSQQVEFRIKATPADDQSELYVNTNVVTASITPYESLISFPSELYMIGDNFGDWDWSNPNVAEMIPVNGRAGEFWAIRYFNANKQFKWFPEKTFEQGGFNGKGTNVGFELTDENATVTADGLYIVYIDLPNNKITLEEAKVYGIGDAFGDWSERTYPFVIDGQMMEITAPNSATELRMYATCSATIADWWRMEFIVRDGVIEYRANGSDQEPRVPINAGEKVTLNFNAGTGTIN